MSDIPLGKIEPGRTALLLIDFQRRHLDAEIAYHPVSKEEAERIVRNARRLLEFARTSGIPVIFVETFSRRASKWGIVDARNAYWEAQANRVVPGSNFVRRTGRNVEGSVYAEILPDLAPGPDDIRVLKKRYSAFYGSDLELVLRGLGVDTLIVAGVNTNNCVLSTCFDAFNRDYRIIVIEDCCGSMNGADMHEFAIKEIKAALGWVRSSEEMATLLRSEHEQGAARP
ncbi:MAG: cysteine hydrolase [Firmicutes bacterium]|nr:cysteine hydrolase [Bacillota bacterium]